MHPLPCQTHLCNDKSIRLTPSRSQQCPTKAFGIQSFRSFDGKFCRRTIQSVLLVLFFPGIAPVPAPVVWRAWKGNNAVAAQNRDLFLSAAGKLPESDMHHLFRSTQRSWLNTHVIFFLRCGDEKTERLATQFGVTLVCCDISFFEGSRGLLCQHPSHVLRRYLEERLGQSTRVHHEGLYFQEQIQSAFNRQAFTNLFGNHRWVGDEEAYWHARLAEVRMRKNCGSVCGCNVIPSNGFPACVPNSRSESNERWNSSTADIIANVSMEIPTQERSLMREVSDVNVRTYWRSIMETAPIEEMDHVAAIAKIILDPPPQPHRGSSRGIVMSGGGQMQITNAYGVVRAVRALGSKLKVELFYAGVDEMSAEMVQLLEPLGVSCLDIYHSEGVLHDMHLRGWQVKALAVYHSSFSKCIWLDTDALPARDPAWVFDTAEFREKGNIFWQDWSTDPHWITKDFFQAYGLNMRIGDRELEAGQFALDKSRCWVPLNVALYLNINFQHFYRRMYGDKDTWRLAFLLVREPLGLAPYPAQVIGSNSKGISASFCGNTMLHLDDAGSPAFFHRTLQTYPSVQTPIPYDVANLPPGVMRSLALLPASWTFQTTGGVQCLRPRSESSIPGWLVEKLDDRSVQMTNSWCVQMRFDSDVSLLALSVNSSIHLTECSLRGFLLALNQHRAVLNSLHPS